MTRRRLTRPLGATLAAVLALQLALSLVWLGRELHHVCTGEACPICQAMGQVTRAVTQGTVGTATVLALARAPRAIAGAPTYVAPERSVCTLVSLGVRLDT